MKIELIGSQSLVNGIKDIAKRFGPSALILRNIEAGGQEMLLIAHEQIEASLQQQVTAATVPQAALETPPSRPATKIRPEELEQVRQVINSLPITTGGLEDLLNAQLKRSASSAKRSAPESDNALQTNLTRLLDETPISQYLRNQLARFSTEPATKIELLAQLKTGLMSRLPPSAAIDLESPIHVIAGNYGAGKTSIALKFAAQLMAASDQRVKVVCVGPHARETEAKTASLGALLGVSSLSVESLKGLYDLVDSATPDTVYIFDLNSEFIESVELIKSRYPAAQCHFIIPSDASLPGLWSNCSAVTWQSLIITRLDLDLVPWAALEAGSKLRVPLSIGSTSSSLAAPLVQVNNENLANRVVSYVADHLSEQKDTFPDRKFNEIRAIH
jgi:hypothetical protein